MMLSYKVWHNCLSPEAHTLEILIHTQEPKHEAWDANCPKKERPSVCKRASTRLASYLTRSPGTKCPCRSSNLPVPPTPHPPEARLPTRLHSLTTCQAPAMQLLVGGGQNSFQPHDGNLKKIMRDLHR